jgi:probable HAF family extracellular repeat protein
MNAMHLLPALTIGAITFPALGDATTIRYEVVDLGEPPQPHAGCVCFSTHEANDAGEAIGLFFGADGTYNTFVFRDGAMIDISPPGENETFPRAINDLGWAVGWSNAFGFQHAYLHDGKTFHDLGTMGGRFSEARDITSDGRIVGSADTRDGDQHAALWVDGTWTDLGTIGGEFSEARAINERGTIVGRSWDADRVWRSVRWTPDLEGPFTLPTFGEPDRQSDALDVNADDVIVGKVELPPIEGGVRWRAALWRDGEVTDLGLLAESGVGESWFGGTPHVSTVAQGINDAGVVVGLSSPPSVEPDRPGPFVWRDGAMTNLNDLLVASSRDWIVSDAKSITNDGVIAASARLIDDEKLPLPERRAVLLRPVEVPLGDLDGDGAVGAADLVALLAVWGPCPGCPADLDRDGTVGVGDLLVLLAAWGG